MHRYDLDSEIKTVRGSQKRPTTKMTLNYISIFLCFYSNNPASIGQFSALNGDIQEIAFLIKHLFLCN